MLYNMPQMLHNLPYLLYNMPHMLHNLSYVNVSIFFNNNAPRLFFMTNLNMIE